MEVSQLPLPKYSTQIGTAMIIINPLTMKEMLNIHVFFQCPFFNLQFFGDDSANIWASHSASFGAEKFAPREFTYKAPKCQLEHGWLGMGGYFLPRFLLIQIIYRDFYS